MVETERKFLLKRVPHIQYDDCIMIDQYYISDRSADKTERVRISQRDNQDPTYIYTSKEKISDMSANEIERDLTEEEFNEYLGQSDRNITKTRWVKEQNDLKWEIDQMIGINLIIAEIEIPSEDYPLHIPHWIEDNLVMEVTGCKHFSNSNLAE